MVDHGWPMFIEAEKICCSTAQRRADLAADRGQPCDFCIFFVDILQTPHWTLEPMAQVGLLGILLLCLASIAYKVFVNKFTEVQPIGASLKAFEFSTLETGMLPGWCGRMLGRHLPLPVGFSKSSALHLGGGMGWDLTFNELIVRVWSSSLNVHIWHQQEFVECEFHRWFDSIRNLISYGFAHWHIYDCLHTYIHIYIICVYIYISVFLYIFCCFKINPSFFE